MWVYLTAGAIDAAHALLLRAANDFIRQGRVAESIEALPHERRQRDCWLMYWLGIASLANAPDKARPPLQASFELAQRQGDKLCRMQAAAGNHRHLHD